VTVVFRFVRAIAFDILRTLYSVRESGVTPFPTILALRYSWVHICSADGDNIFSNIKTSVN